MSEAPFRSPNAIGMESCYRILLPYLLFLGWRQNVPQLPLLLLALLHYWYIFFLYRISHDRKIVKLVQIFIDRSPQKVTELGTSGKTLAELSSPSAMQELEGGKYLCFELDGVEHLGWIAGLDPRVIGSGRVRKRNAYLKAVQHQKLVPTCSLERRWTQSARPM